jgi:hypothetical protein
VADALDSWDKVAAFALTLAGTVAGTSYGKPAVKIAANGRSFLHLGREPATSFVVEIDVATVDMLLATDPDSFWQTAHYVGWPALLVRYASRDPDRVRAVIGQARVQAAARKAARPRKR